MSGGPLTINFLLHFLLLNIFLVSHNTQFYYFFVMFYAFFLSFKDCQLSLFLIVDVF